MRQIADEGARDGDCHRRVDVDQRHRGNSDHRSAVNALVKTYVASRPLQSGGFDQLAASDKSGKGPRGAVDVDDEMLTLVKFASGPGRL
jgi:hypothetical protein